MKILDKIIDYIFPFRCSACTNLTESNGGICASCWPKFNFVTKPYCAICCEKFHVNMNETALCAKCISSRPKVDITRSLLEFSPEAKKLIHKFKYNDKTILGKFFAKQIYNRFEEDLRDIDLIAPVPMHKLKRVFRNYNPPQILALELSKLLHKPVTPGLLIKQKMTKTQVGLTRNQRAKNLAGSFGLNQNFDIKDKIILLVDDVLTTGATSSECSKILKKAGAQSVKLVTIAKVSLGYRS
jgi:ComF family protein